MAERLLDDILTHPESPNRDFCRSTVLQLFSPWQLNLNISTRRLQCPPLPLERTTHHHVEDLAHRAVATFKAARALVEVLAAQVVAMADSRVER